MDDTTEITEVPKRRKAELIKPPHTIKQKVGSGGIDPRLIEKAQNTIDNNDIDFIPIGQQLVDEMESAIANTRNGLLKGEAAIEAIIYPAMQMKAQGAMLQYALVTDISDILVNFLETVSSPDNDVLDVADAHKKTLQLVIVKQMKDNKNAVAAQLRQALVDACNRYYKHHPAA